MAQRQRPAHVQTWPVRVYYHHTDAGGVVYHGTYLDFFEAARIELLRALGFDLAELAQRRAAMFIVYGLQVSYRRPARLNDALEVTAEIARLGRVRVEFAQHVRRAGETIVSARVEAACVHPRTFRPVPLPEELREGLERIA
ncbi:MAG: tol-pal system-associated acyl-CoA thioesterase [Burkholderiales bacterium]|nr:tol-pal system-associated acyl-CoA thioesterase [Burkholderiales bacterium]